MAAGKSRCNHREENAEMLNRFQQWLVAQKYLANTVANYCGIGTVSVRLSAGRLSAMCLLSTFRNSFLPMLEVDGRMVAESAKVKQFSEAHEEQELARSRSLRVGKRLTWVLRGLAPAGFMKTARYFLRKL